MCSFIWNIVIILSEPLQCFSTRRLWIKQRSSVVNPTIVTKLRFIHLKAERVYIGRRRTTSFDENDTWVNENCKRNVSNNWESSLPNGVVVANRLVKCTFWLLVHKVSTPRLWWRHDDVPASRDCPLPTDGEILISYRYRSQYFSIDNYRIDPPPMLSGRSGCVAVDISAKLNWTHWTAGIMRSLDSVVLSVCLCATAWRHNDTDVIALSSRHQQIGYCLWRHQQQRWQ